MSSVTEEGREEGESRKRNVKGHPRIVDGKEALGYLPEFEVATAPATSVPPGRDSEKEE